MCIVVVSFVSERTHRFVSRVMCHYSRELLTNMRFTNGIAAVIFPLCSPRSPALHPSLLLLLILLSFWVRNKYDFPCNGFLAWKQSNHTYFTLFLWNRHRYQFNNRRTIEAFFLKFQHKSNMMNISRNALFHFHIHFIYFLFIHLKRVKMCSHFLNEFDFSALMDYCCSKMYVHVWAWACVCVFVLVIGNSFTTFLFRFDSSFSLLHTSFQVNTDTNWPPNRVWCDFKLFVSCSNGIDGNGNENQRRRVTFAHSPEMTLKGVKMPAMLPVCTQKMWKKNCHCVRVRCVLFKMKWKINENQHFPTIFSCLRQNWKYKTLKSICHLFFSSSFSTSSTNSAHSVVLPTMKWWFRFSFDSIFSAFSKLSAVAQSTVWHSMPCCRSNILSVFTRSNQLSQYLAHESTFALWSEPRERVFNTKWFWFVEQLWHRGLKWNRSFERWVQQGVGSVFFLFLFVHLVFTSSHFLVYTLFHLRFAVIRLTAVDLIC